MSAYLVNDDTLDLLTSALLWSNNPLAVRVQHPAGPDTLPPRGDLAGSAGQPWVYYTHEDVQQVRDELKLENLASVRARYPNADFETLNTGATRFRPIYQDQATPAEMLGALRCYEYQACETDEWELSHAYALCKAIKNRIVSQLSDGLWEYERSKSYAERVRII